MQRLSVLADKKEFGIWQDPKTSRTYKTIVAWASKPVLDRSDEIIDADAWDLKEFNKNPVLMLSHDYSQLPIGSIMWTKKTPEGLKFKARFANTDIAKEVAQLYEEDIMRAFSVGFIPTEHVDETIKSDGKEVRVRRYTKASLLEVSCVAIGCCPDALVENMQKGLIKTKDFSETITFLSTHTRNDEGEIIEIVKDIEPPVEGEIIEEKEEEIPTKEEEVIEEEVKEEEVIEEEEIVEDGCGKPKPKPKPKEEDEKEVPASSIKETINSLEQELKELKEMVSQLLAKKEEIPPVETIEVNLPEQIKEEIVFSLDVPIKEEKKQPELFDYDTTAKIISEVVGKFFDEKIVKDVKERMVNKQVEILIAKAQGKVTI